MDERIEKWLYDIRIAIDEINSYFIDGEKNFLLVYIPLGMYRSVEKCKNQILLHSVRNATLITKYRLHTYGMLFSVVISVFYRAGIPNGILSCDYNNLKII